MTQTHQFIITYDREKEANPQDWEARNVAFALTFLTCLYFKALILMNLFIYCTVHLRQAAAVSQQFPSR